MNHQKNKTNVNKNTEHLLRETDENKCLLMWEGIYKPNEKLKESLTIIAKKKGVKVCVFSIW